ncbi:MAG: hypothetical protein ABI426_10125 [Flavobacterium sp.]
MASTSEVGHNKNAANFNALAQILQEMGSLYNPSNTNIQLPILDGIKTNLLASIANLNEKKPLYSNAVANREVAAEPLGKTATKVLNAFKSLRLSEVDKENATSLVKKIRGDRKAKKVNPDTSDAETISTAQLSYDSRIANLDVLIGFIQSHPEYSPNEASITVPSLTTYNQELKNLTQIVNAAGNTLITARKNRNAVLYKDANNVIILAREIKSYLKPIGEPGLPYYKAAVRLRFTEVA